ncbi:MAG: A/G-specific adenine glycosylase [Thioalkalivibrionaceae bacterium]
MNRQLSGPTSPCVVSGVMPQTEPQSSATDSEVCFAGRLLKWFDEHGRHDLPWQRPRSIYRVWLSEVMLQQTQVETVRDAFQRFVLRFSTLETLAAASLDEVLTQWAGLGYYARARNLHRAAQTVVEAGGFPLDREGLEALPGIGRSTAAAICAQAYGQREAILDGNAKRLFARHAGIPGWPGTPAVARKLWEAAEARLPAENCGNAARMPDYTQAVMDVGATLCLRRRPRCVECPVNEDCAALSSDRVGSIPAPRPARVRPLVAMAFAVLCDEGGRVWFERRSEDGVWGGLYALPEIDVAALGLWEAPEGFAESVVDHVGERAAPFVVVPSEWRRAPDLDAVIEHDLTHRRLRLELKGWRRMMPAGDALAANARGPAGPAERRTVSLGSVPNKDLGQTFRRDESDQNVGNDAGDALLASSAAPAISLDSLVFDRPGLWLTPGDVTPGLPRPLAIWWAQRAVDVVVAEAGDATGGP